MQLTLGDKLTYFTTKNNNVATFDFYIPKLNDKIKEILINFDLRNYYDLTGNYFVTLTNSLGGLIEGETNWDLGKSFVIKKGDLSWCTNCTLKC